MSAMPSPQIMSETPDTSPAPPEGGETQTTPQDTEMAELDDSAMTLPISRIKKIFKMDPEFVTASPAAVYATGVATELFVQYLTDHAAMIAKVEKRKKIQYKDVSTAVTSHDALYFLSDTVPKTVPVAKAAQDDAINLAPQDQDKYKSVVPEKEPKAAPELPKGQQTLPFATEAPIKKAPLQNLMGDDMVVD